jgi:acyl carrier protein
MEQRIKSVMAMTFGLDVNRVGNDASPDTLERWDSLKHMQLILSLEEEFSVEFSDDQVTNLVSYQKIFDAIRDMS